MPAPMHKEKRSLQVRRASSHARLRGAVSRRTKRAPRTHESAIERAIARCLRALDNFGDALERTQRALARMEER